jgi:hypothetical protein
VAVPAAGLFAATFSGWLAHEGLDGPDGDRLRATESLIQVLSGWELGSEIAATVLLAVLLGLLAARTADRRDVVRPVACGLAGGAGALAAWRIARVHESPPDEIYTDPRLGIYLALVAALALVVTGLLALVLSFVGRDRDESPGASKPIWPLVAGAAALYGLALFVNETELWAPQWVGACCLSPVIGYFIPRWWLAPLPLAAVIVFLELSPDPCDPDVTDCSESIRSFYYALIALTTSVALAIGIATRWLERRAIAQQQV